MLNRRSTKIVDAVLLLASAAGVLAIAWAEGSLSSGDASGPNFQLIGPDTGLTRALASRPIRCWWSISGSRRVGVLARQR
jgi:hypothetical protein